MAGGPRKSQNGSYLIKSTHERDSDQSDSVIKALPMFNVCLPCNTHKKEATLL